MTKGEETKSIPVTQQMVWNAYHKVKSNGGSAGVDKVSLEEFKVDLDKNLYKIWNRLTSGSYFPPAVREKSIPKKDGSKRKLGIPTVSDRIAQQVIKSYLEPRLESQFHKWSYGYRPLRSAHQAIEQIRENLHQYRWVLDMDISKFFDRMDHELLMKAIEKHVPEKWVKLYLKRWLEAPSEDEQGNTTEKNGIGTPQGGVISPLLANLFLHYALDKWLDKQYPDLSFVRYADDIVVHCRHELEAKEVLEAIRKRLQECSLELNEKKSKIVYCAVYKRQKLDYSAKFDFLGFSFQPRTIKLKGNTFKLTYDCAISQSSKSRIVEVLNKTKLHKRSELSITEIARELNPKLRGWINYYGKYNKREFTRVLRIFSFRLMKWALNKYKNLGGIKTGFQWLNKCRKENPNLFAHWELGYREM